MPARVRSRWTALRSTLTRHVDARLRLRPRRLGWSEPGTSRRNPQQFASELHLLLTNAGVEGPYVLVAHSISGKTARLFASQHPNDVAGMVLIDARHEFVTIT